MAEPLNFYSRDDSLPVNFYAEDISIRSTRISLEGMAETFTNQTSTSGVYSRTNSLSNDFTFKRMMVDCATTIPVGQKIIFQLYKNDAPTDMRLVLEGSYITYLDMDVSASKYDLFYTQVTYVNVGTYNFTKHYNLSYLIEGTGSQNMFSRGGFQLNGIFASEISLKEGNSTNLGNFPLLHTYFPTSGTLENLTLRLNIPAILTTTGFGTAHWGIEVNKNNYDGTTLEILANSDSALVYENTVDDQSVVVKDKFVITTAFSGNANLQDGLQRHVACIDFTPDTPGSFVYSLTASNFISVDDTFYYTGSGMGAPNSWRSSEPFITFPYSGTISNVHIMVEAELTTTGGGTSTITMRKNSIDTDVVFIFTRTGSTLTAESTAVINIDVGDRISFTSVTNSGWTTDSPTVNISYVFNSDHPNYYPVFFTHYSSGTAGILTSSIPINVYGV